MIIIWLIAFCLSTVLCVAFTAVEWYELSFVFLLTMLGSLIGVFCELVPL